jgi:hypothetical protein
MSPAQLTKARGKTAAATTTTEFSPKIEGLARLDKGYKPNCRHHMQQGRRG